MRNLFGLLVFTGIFVVACDRSAETERTPAKPSGDAAHGREHSPDDGHDHGHTPDDGHDHDKTGSPDEHATGHGLGVIDLGTAKVNELVVRASRDKGEIKPSGDAPIDVWISMADGKPAAVSAVRFWIGTEDAKGSIKAKAEIEDQKEPNRWHTHAEVPDSSAAESRLWVELEMPSGQKSKTSFDLKQ